MPILTSHRHALRWRTAALNTDIVTVPASASLNTLPAITILMWVYLIATGSAKSFVAKRTNTPSTLGWHIVGNGTTGNFEFGWPTSGTAVQFVTSSTPLAPSNKWYCVVAYSIPGTSGGLYVGDLNNPLTAPTLSTNQVGTGTPSDDSALNLSWGNWTPGARGFDGSIAIGAIFNRQLAYSEMVDWQFRPRYLAGCVNLMYFGRQGTFVVYDESGRANHGTGSGVVATNDGLPVSRLRAPIRVPVGRSSLSV